MQRFNTNSMSRNITLMFEQLVQNLIILMNEYINCAALSLNVGNFECPIVLNLKKRNHEFYSTF